MCDSAPHHVSYWRRLSGPPSGSGHTWPHLDLKRKEHSFSKYFNTYTRILTLYQSGRSHLMITHPQKKCDMTIFVYGHPLQFRGLYIFCRVLLLTYQHKNLVVAVQKIYHHISGISTFTLL